MSKFENIIEILSDDNTQRTSIDLSEFKRQDASGGVDTPAPSSQIPDFVLKRSAIIVPFDKTQVE